MHLLAASHRSVCSRNFEVKQRLSCRIAVRLFSEELWVSLLIYKSLEVFCILLSMNTYCPLPPNLTVLISDRKADRIVWMDCEMTGLEVRTSLLWVLLAKIIRDVICVFTYTDDLCLFWSVLMEVFNAHHPNYLYTISFQIDKHTIVEIAVIVTDAELNVWIWLFWCHIRTFKFLEVVLNQISCKN